MSSLREIFGLATTSSYIRGTVMGFDNTRLKNICEGICVGFGLNNSDGDTLFFYYQSNNNLLNSIGFDDSSHFALYQSDVQTLIDNFLPSESAINRQTLALAAFSVIWGYALNQTTDINTIVTTIGQVLTSVAQTANGNQPFAVINKVVISPFDSNAIQNLLKNNYSPSFKEVAESSKTEQTQVANYNWFDVSNIFAKPNLQIMKDIENQYYYISGAFLYEAEEKNWRASSNLLF